MKIRNLLTILGVTVAISGCSGGDGFADLDQFMDETKAKPRGKVEPLPEFKAYQSFTYSAANRRDPFSPPVDVVLSSVAEEKPESNVKPDLDRPKELLETFGLGSLKMVGTLQRQDGNTLWALISDNEGGIHRVKTGQFLGKNHGRIVAIEESQLELIEIVPNGRGGWLERPRSISLDDQ
ncbi:pilus assembly protein PilP [Alkalimarinus sediminis]|uniref:Pilus assembly protein PilP n=1 Tax=Alkalimarinus sediminis TaxID=1632866 RepID=A0A9E8HP69_9ALTE|nr:pilus assembly protein PilP [Alkalimarinus sediminis]UZW73931.1 pilus assembly protein PilP [Alkalimarinus sediminis]